LKIASSGSNEIESQATEIPDNIKQACVDYAASE
jgi:hypothetical protein